MSNNPLLTTRFNNATYQQNSRVRKENEEIGCIYGSPMAINEKYTSFDSLSFMIEMNNEANRIEGIGLIRNRICFDRRFQILYDNGNYNRYIYKGSYRLDRLVIEENEDEATNIINVEKVIKKEISRIFKTYFK